MNDTGETIYGLRIVFSEPVTLASFGDIMTVVAHIGESTEFMFSGGSLEEWAGHWFNWEPASASLVSHEWFADPATVETAASDWAAYEASRPFWERNPNPTYEEIMAEIAEYPGPDEPLYEPAPDEAIWLTDLEGHADIYDNDSIKINYADSFDQSRVTKIEAYRNGVKMEFVPNEFDVLTNDQMKTFDGNPLEHSPASNHTDHAIFGYEYEFRFYAGLSSTFVTTTAAAQAPLSVNKGYHYINHIGWYQEMFDLSDSQLRDFYRSIAKAGWDGIQLDYWLLVSSPDAVDVWPYYYESEEINCYLKTPRDDELRYILRLIDSVGLKAGVRICIFLDNRYVVAHGERVYSSDFAPASVERFLDDLGDEVVHIAQVAEEAGCDMITALTEMSSIEQYDELIREYLSRIDEVFSGELAVDQATHHYMNEDSKGEAELLDRLNRASFWDWQSEEGQPLLIMMNIIDPRLSPTLDPQLQHLVEEVFRQWEPIVNYYKSRYPGHPVLYGEAAVNWTDGASMGWEVASQSSTQDWQELADVLCTIVLAAQGLGIDGILYEYVSREWHRLIEELNVPLVIPPPSRLALEGLFSDAP